MRSYASTSSSTVLVEVLRSVTQLLESGVGVVVVSVLTGPPGGPPTDTPARHDTDNRITLQSFFEQTGPLDIET